MRRSEPRVVIVGGGVIGVCCAYDLVRRGARVTLLERDRIGRGASYGNAGAIAPGHGPINKPGRVRQALTSLLSPLSPLYIAPRLDPRLLGWLLDFARHCTASHAEYGLRALAPLGRATIRLFEQLAEEEDLDCQYMRAGYYEVYRTEAGIAAAHREVETMHRHGFGAEFLDGPALREREPALKPSILGGAFFPEAATVNPYRFVSEMADRAERYGAVMRAGADVRNVFGRSGRVQGVELVGGERIEADAVVIAAGVHSNALTGKLGLHLPLQAAKGYHEDRVPRRGQTPALRQTCMLGEASVFCTPMGGFIRFAGTLEFSGINGRMRRSRLDQLTKAADSYLHGMGDATAQSQWCGLRPCLSDGLPVVGPILGLRGAFVATGHAMLGLTLGPVTGQLIAEYVLDEEPSMDVSALVAHRF
ncbi:MAG: FAD-dependent oxidoreductase [Gemmatimonadales bacterium]